MTYERPVLVIFHGATGLGEAERMMAAARVAAARATATAALAAGFEAVIFATDDPPALEPIPDGVLIDADAVGERFEFAPRLRRIVERFGLGKPAVMGSGSVPLLGIEEFRLIVEQLESRDARFVTNNFFSADLTAWTPGNAIFRIDDFPRDNVLPRRLRDEAGLAPILLPRTTATQFDLDTPADLAVLWLQEGLPGELHAAARPAQELAERYRKVMRILCDRTAQLVVAGRVGSMTWQYLERETACRIRMFSEERGLAAATPDHFPRSALGFLLEEVGVERFFERMAELGDALVLDTRVIEAHMGVSPSREDRFQSDLMNWEAIEEPFLRRFTRGAANAPRPVLLGGHSLVAGGLMALNDVAWAENDRRLGLA
ncbi:MAG TPA: hypothetical protein VFY90_07915 [Tepidiformaceae bacterium]|nr:hypothetical protein [Tepidiformaceae bacterium]